MAILLLLFLSKNTLAQREGLKSVTEGNVVAEAHVDVAQVVVEPGGDGVRLADLLRFEPASIL